MSERAQLLIEIIAVTLLAWLYLIKMPTTAADLGGFAARMLAPLPSPIIDLSLTFMMWAVMMVAMMLPSASPMILTYARLASGRGGAIASRTWAFTGGYLAIWTAFSLGATLLQAALARISIVSGAMTVTPIAGAAILVVAGAYQITPWKNVCLRYCQSPIAFFMTRWRDGVSGAFRMGVQHGIMCVGCCWMLMALLFVAGVMNLAWVAAITIFVLLEKLVPYPRAVSYSAGALLVTSGFIVFLRG